METTQAQTPCIQQTFGFQALGTRKIEFDFSGGYLFYLCNNHRFVDGNKRVAFATCIIFLKINGFHPSPDSPLWETLGLDIAASRIGKAEPALGLKSLISGSP